MMMIMTTTTMMMMMCECRRQRKIEVSKGTFPWRLTASFGERDGDASYGFKDEVEMR